MKTIEQSATRLVVQSAESETRPLLEQAAEAVFGESLGKLFAKSLAPTQDVATDVVNEGMHLVADELEIFRVAMTSEEFAYVGPHVVAGVLSSLSERLRVLAELNLRIMNEADQLHEAEESRVLADGTAVRQ